MGKDAREQEVRKLRRSAEWALRKSLEPSDVVAVLQRLLRMVPPDSEDALFAHRHLAELTVEQEPWKAALSARRLIAANPDDDQGWALLALALTLLSHYQAAVRAYRRALALSPQNPWYAHNLGHLLDVGLDRPNDGLALLQSAHRREPQETEIASSYAHALGRVGKIEEARDLLRRSIRDGGNREQRALLAWLDEATAERQPVRRRKTRSTAPTEKAPRRKGRGA